MPCASAPRRLLFEVGANNGAWAAKYLAAHPNVTVYLLEPNRRFDAELALLVRAHGAVHLRAAAWTSDGNATFHFSRNDESSSLVEGRARRWAPTSTLGRRFPCRPASSFAPSTAYARKRAWDGRIDRRHGKLAICDRPRAQTVPTIDLAALVRRVACKEKDALGLHLDVEGAEYEVLEHLLSTGVACWFRDGVSLEWHETAERDRASERQRIMRRLRACGIGVRTEEGVSRYVS